MVTVVVIVQTLTLMTSDDERTRLIHPHSHTTNTNKFQMFAILGAAVVLPLSFFLTTVLPPIWNIPIDIYRGFRSQYSVWYAAIGEGTTITTPTPSSFMMMITISHRIIVLISFFIHFQELVNTMTMLTSLSNFMWT